MNQEIHDKTISNLIEQIKLRDRKIDQLKDEYDALSLNLKEFQLQVYQLNEHLSEKERGIRSLDNHAKDQHNIILNLTKELSEAQHKLDNDDLSNKVIVELKEKLEEAQFKIDQANMQLNENQLIYNALITDAKVQEKAFSAMESHAIDQQTIINDLSIKLAQKDQFISILESQMQNVYSQLQSITSSRGFAILQRMHRIRLKFIPAHGKREKILNIAYKSAKTLKNQGLKGLFRKSVIYLVNRNKSNLINVYKSNYVKSKSDSHSYNEQNDSKFFVNSYEDWLKENEPSNVDLAMQKRSAQMLPYKPLFSIIVPVYNTPLYALRMMLDSVIEQTYDDWELCIANASTDNEQLTKILDSYSKRDMRIKVLSLKNNNGISSNSNEALSIANGEFIALLDHDDSLSPFALYEVAKRLNVNPNYDMIYSDEDKIDENGYRHTPFFKPDWSPDLLQSFMYIGHLTIYRKSIIEKVGGFRKTFDFSQDYDLALRVTENIEANKIAHIPLVLYHWRTLPESGASGGKPFARQSNLAALNDAMQRRGYDVEVLEYPTSNRVKFIVKEQPSISIIIPSDNWDNISNCINTILKVTSYIHYEILIVTKTELAKKVEYTFSDKIMVRPIRYDKPFNFSDKCNVGVNCSSGEFVLFLNDDVQPLEQDWLETLVGYFQQKDVGAVSPMLLYSDGMIQHAGLVTGVRGLFGTAFHTHPSNTTAYFNLAQSTRTTSALSAACLIMRKEVFTKIEGFDAINTPIMHSDVDLCFKIRDQGLRLVYTPFTRLSHVGHASIGVMENEGEKHSEKADTYVINRWGGYTSYDPFYNDNMRYTLFYDSPTPYKMFAKNNSNYVPGKADVLFISHDMTLSGAPIIMNMLTTKLKRDFSITVISPLDGALRETYTSQGTSVIIDPLIKSSPNSVTKLFNDYDIIVVNTILSWRSVKVAKEMGKKVIWLVHESDYGVQMAIDERGVRECLTNADLVVFPSRETELKYKRFDRGNHKTIEIGIDIHKDPLLETLHQSNDVIKIVHVGAIEPRKGQDILVDAIASLPEEIRNRCEVLFIGRIHDPGFCNSFVQKIKGKPYIRWLGELEHKSAAKYIATSDIFVCTSRDETGPMVVLEAMAYGRAIISTPVGVMRESLKNESNGLRVPIGDIKSVADSIERLVMDSSLRIKLGNNAKQTFDNHFTIERYASDIQKAILDTIAS